MSAFQRKGRRGWSAKFQHRGKVEWVPGGPWATKREALAAEERQRTKLAARRTNETAASFANRWLDDWPRPATATMRQYGDAAKRFAEHFGTVPLASIGRDAAYAFARSQPRGISRIVAVMFGDAIDAGLLDSNSFARLRLPATDSAGTITPPTMDEYRRLVAACPALDNGYAVEFRAAIQFSAWTGVRAGELQALKWADVSEDTIHVRRSRKRDGTDGLPKGGRERVIAFPPPARVLDDLPVREDGYVFHAPRGGRLDQGSLFYSWRIVRAAARLPKCRWHDLRHFAATQLLEMGLDPFAVSIQLGHQDGGRLVMQRYGHPSHDAARARLLDAFSADVPESVAG